MLPLPQSNVHITSIMWSVCVLIVLAATSAGAQSISTCTSQLNGDLSGTVIRAVSADSDPTTKGSSPSVGGVPVETGLDTRNAVFGSPRFSPRNSRAWDASAVKGLQGDVQELFRGMAWHASSLSVTLDGLNPSALCVPCLHGRPRVRLYVCVARCTDVLLIRAHSVPEARYASDLPAGVCS